MRPKRYGIDIVFWFNDKNIHLYWSICESQADVEEDHYIFSSLFCLITVSWYSEFDKEHKHNQFFCFNYYVLDLLIKIHCDFIQMIQSLYLRLTLWWTLFDFGVYFYYVFNVAISLSKKKFKRIFLQKICIW